jgi:hypothetical protein
MKRYGLYAAMLLLAGCFGDGDFVKHKLTAEKAGACMGSDGEVKMVSNTNGERYQFSICLPVGFAESDCNVSRQGDTVLVAFPEAKGATAKFNLTLDVDAKPRYRFIQLGKQLLTVLPTTPY